MEEPPDQDTTAIEMTVILTDPRAGNPICCGGGGHLGKQCGQQEAEGARGKCGYEPFLCFPQEKKIGDRE